MVIKKKEKSAAVVTVFDASKMTPAGRKAIAKWLRGVSETLLKYGIKPGFAKRWTSRYIYR